MCCARPATPGRSATARSSWTRTCCWPRTSATSSSSTRKENNNGNCCEDRQAGNRELPLQGSPADRRWEVRRVARIVRGGRDLLGALQPLRHRPQYRGFAHLRRQVTYEGPGVAPAERFSLLAGAGVEGSPHAEQYGARGN